METTQQATSPLPEANSYATFHNFLKNIFFFILGLAIVALSIAGGVLLYAYTNGGTTSLLPFQRIFTKQQASSLPTNNIVTSETKTETGQSQKVYKNTTFNFSFVIPAEYQAKESAYGLGITSVELRKQNNLDESYSPNIQILIFPKAMAKLVGQDFDEFYAMEDNSLKQVNDSQGSQMFTKIVNRKVQELRAFDYKTISATPSTNEQAEAGSYIEAGPNIIIFSTTESEKATLEPILQTLKYPLK